MKLSIITVNKNNAQGLERTIQSVINQTFKDFEYIIIDGASTDSSVGVIKKYADKIDYWVSEPDTGIYNAMNKGIKVAKGEYLLFLNSGDWLVDEKILYRACLYCNAYDFIYGKIKYSKSGSIYGKEFNYSDLLFQNIHHQAIFYKRIIFDILGIYSEKFEIVADYELNIKIFRTDSFKIKYIDEIISLVEDNGISTEKIDIEFYKRFCKNFVFYFKDKVKKEMLVHRWWLIFSNFLHSSEVSFFDTFILIFQYFIFAKSIGGLMLSIRRLIQYKIFKLR